MRIAVLPEEALGPLAAGLDQYLAGMGQVRLLEDNVDPQRLNARGALREARLGLGDLDSFLTLDGAQLDAFFTRLRVLLFDRDRPVGSVGLVEGEDGGYAVEHVTLGGVDELVPGLAEAEEAPGNADREARLVHVPQLYLTALVLVAENRAPAFRVLSPPYPEAARESDRGDFHGFVDDLVAEHRRVFDASEDD